MSEIIEKNKYYLVKSEFGSYTFNNRKTAEQLNYHLNNYEKLNKQSQQTQLDNITKEVIQLQMSLSIVQDDLDKLKKELSI